MQLPLFAEAAFLVRVRPGRDEARFFDMKIWPDLFGRALLICRWGRLGAGGRERRSRFADPGAAINALSWMLLAKHRRGYREVPVCATDTLRIAKATRT